MANAVTNYDFCVDWARAHATDGYARVLDYGCGSGQIVGRLRAGGIDAFGCDVFYGGGDWSSSIDSAVLPYVRRMNGSAIPFDTATFDLVVSNQVFEHVEDLESVLAEISRVLRPAGILLSLFPDKSVWREGHCEIPFLHRFPKRSTFRVYYAASMRTLGLGAHKDGKGILEWSRDFCRWLDDWTYYRSKAEINCALSKHFQTTEHIENYWLLFRTQGRPGASQVVRALPSALQRLIVRKLAGLVLVSRKGESHPRAIRPSRNSPPP